MNDFSRAGIFVLLLLILAVGVSGNVAHAQDPTPIPTPAPTLPPAPTSPPAPLPTGEGGWQIPELDKVYAIVRMVSDLARGQVSPSPDQLFAQSRQSATDILNQQGAGIFFLDFADPNLPINQFAATVASTLLALTPLYVLAYVVMLVLSVYQERPIPNPLLYAGLVIAVMVFLAAFAVIMRGMSDLGRAVAIALSGSGDENFFAHATLLDQVLRVLQNLQNNGGLLSIVSLLVSLVLAIVTLGELVYRGIALILLRLLSVLVIPFSVLLEGTRPKTAGRILAGFFESWFDLVTKVAVLLIVLALAAAANFANVTWLVLPAGLLLVVLSWKFFSIPFMMIRDAVGRAWGNLVPATAGDYAVTNLPSSAEAARAKEIDEARKRMMEE
ncbi:MAG: hypothetical protein HY741_27145 [Chloroflexi bacterium]|nr:hypothetical protein [Chloroflexota bacterium]